MHPLTAIAGSSPRVVSLIHDPLNRPATYRARWIAPSASILIENGLLTVGGGRITAVGRDPAHTGRTVDLGDVLVLPALVNAHAHLELSDCLGRVPYRGSFTRWLRDLVGRRTAGPTAEERRRLVEEGLNQSWEVGVAVIADIGDGPHALPAWRDFAGVISGFLEVTGIGPKRTLDHPRSLARQLRAAASFRRPRPAKALLPQPPRPQVVGLSPHAPYSVDPEVFRRTILAARRHRLPLCTHLAESPEETRFLADGRGPLRELLEEWGLWDGSFEPPGCSPVRYAAGLGLLKAGCLLVHVNHVDDADLDLLAAARARVVYCPRSHDFFGHAPHRFAEMLARGINVCLGTDSLASNTSLSMLDELAHLRMSSPGIPPQVLLDMATRRGAAALGCEHRLGTLEPGKAAIFIAVPLRHPGTREPCEDILHP